MTNRSSSSRVDCLIIGAGPAGAATAAMLARQGRRVTVLDRRLRIEQKVCGECLSPPSRELLQELGTWGRIPRESRRSLEGITLIGPLGSRCTLSFGSEQPAFTVSRPVLDHALVETAAAAGAWVEWGAAAVSLARDRDWLKTWIVRTRDGREWRAPLLIGADGRQSWVARKLGMAGEEPHWLRHAAILGFFETEGDWPDQVEMHVTSWGYAGLNASNVIAVLNPDELQRRLAGRGAAGMMPLLRELTQGKDATPALRARLAGARPLSERAWSVSPLAWLPARVVGDEVALVGDSAGFVDPFTGEGLYHGLASAVHLGRLLERTALPDALHEYQSWHRGVFGPEERFCLMLQRILPYPRLADYVIRQLGRKQHLSRVLAEAVADRLPTRRVLSPVFWGRVMWPVSGYG